MESDIAITRQNLAFIMSSLQIHVTIQILKTDGVLVKWAVTLVCKWGKYSVNYHVTVYILVANIVSMIWIASSIYKRLIVKDVVP